jgi:aryl-alcohol dehydrogenase-like predicted oxidoreductase
MPRSRTPCCSPSTPGWRQISDPTRDSHDFTYGFGMLSQRTIGDVRVSAVGLGCMPLSNGRMVDQREQAVGTIHAALDAGITLLDTANIYAPSWDAVGHNEALVAEAIRTYSGPASLADVLITTKGGITRSEGEVWGRDSTLDALARACEASLTELGVDTIDLYQHHRHDPDITYLEQIRALEGLKDAGLIRRIGLSNVTAVELDLAITELGSASEGGVVSVQNELSPRYRADLDVLERCEKEGVAFLPWSPLGGATHAKDVGSRFAPFAEVAEELGATPQEVTLAWLLRMSPVMIPIPGGTRPETIASIVRATKVTLTDEQFDRLQATEPEHTSMYPEDQPRSPLR